MNIPPQRPHFHFQSPSTQPRPLRLRDVSLDAVDARAARFLRREALNDARGPGQAGSLLELRQQRRPLGVYLQALRAPTAGGITIGHYARADQWGAFQIVLRQPMTYSTCFRGFPAFFRAPLNALY